MNGEDFIGMGIVFIVGVFLWEDFFGFSILFSIILSLSVILFMCLLFKYSKIIRFAYNDA